MGWTTSSSIGALPTGFVGTSYSVPTPASGNLIYYGPGISGSRAFSQNNLVLARVLIPAELTFNGILCSIISGGSAGSVVRLGIYRSSITTGKPTTLVVDAGTVGGTTTGVKEISLSNVKLTRGAYFLCSVNQGSTTSPTLRTLAGTINNVVAFPSAIFTSPDNTLSLSGVSGSLSSNITSSSFGINSPVAAYMTLRVA